MKKDSKVRKLRCKNYNYFPIQMKEKKRAECLCTEKGKLSSPGYGLSGELSLQCANKENYFPLHFQII